MKTEHDTPVLARRELVRNGFTVAWTPPELPELWVKPGDHRQLAIARDSEPKWHIVPFPKT